MRFPSITTTAGERTWPASTSAQRAARRTSYGTGHGTGSDTQSSVVAPESGTFGCFQHSTGNDA